MTASPMTRSVTFLVLDDDADMRFLHRRELQKEFPGCMIVECETTEEALMRSADVCLDAVLTDHTLRGEDGAVFIVRLREQGVDCPVIMVTGSGDPKVHEAAYAAGATKVFFGTKLGFARYLRPILERAGSLVPFGKAQM
ncbi:MAG TPA: response regulator [Opitutaceae bacterium]|nr:response regulator [Opitutaceae bacterium]